MPAWLIYTSWCGIALGILGCLIVSADLLIAGRQRMAIMNVVWPLTALYAGPIGVLAYYALGRPRRRRADDAGTADHARDADGRPRQGAPPSWSAVAVATTHCGAGCTVGDLCAEWLTLAVPVVLFGHAIFGTWVVDYFLALAWGILFQYFSIAPTRGLSFGPGLWAAFKADVLSLTAWQVGMYGWMAVATFAIFGHPLSKLGPVFWFMMQVAMCAGFVTSYPVNGWLLRTGVKERM